MKESGQGIGQRDREAKTEKETETGLQCTLLALKMGGDREPRNSAASRSWKSQETDCLLEPSEENTPLPTPRLQPSEIYSDFRPLEL